MISNFKLYSAYYDLLYKDKDYQSEAAYVHNHLQKLLPGVTDLLELGSGTGNHARYLSDLGYKITGVERSEEMLELAREKNIRDFKPVLADITDFKMDTQFDAAISLFHSLCYLTTNEELVAAFRAVSQHLKPGGIFAFDFWYGPAVLHHLPIARTKHQQNELVQVTRKGETTMFIAKNVAEVNYEVSVADKTNRELLEFTETHPMRYFSIPEIALLASQAGFAVVGVEEFLTAAQPTLESWNMFIMLEKQTNA